LGEPTRACVKVIEGEARYTMYTGQVQGKCPDSTDDVGEYIMIGEVGGQRLFVTGLFLYHSIDILKCKANPQDKCLVSHGGMTAS
jgi:hypothetical protein